MTTANYLNMTTANYLNNDMTTAKYFNDKCKIFK